MKLVKTEDAVGHVLCHDITQIIKGVTKDAVFRKGHIITEEDIPVLLSVALTFEYGLVNDFLSDWCEMKTKLNNGEISPNEYFEWKITWPHA